MSEWSHWRTARKRRSARVHLNAQRRRLRITAYRWGRPRWAHIFDAAIAKAGESRWSALELALFYPPISSEVAPGETGHIAAENELCPRGQYKPE